MKKKLIAAAAGVGIVCGSVGIARASTGSVASSTNSMTLQTTLTTEVVTASTVSPGFPTNLTATATCPAGTVVTGGGYVAGQAGGTAVGESYPDNNGWTAFMTGGPSGALMTVYAVCASLG